MAENFPRGGKHPKKTFLELEGNELNFFKTTDRQNDNVVATRKRKHNSNDLHVGVLHFWSLREGMLIFGRIMEVKDFKIKVSLPHGLLGTLPITSISTAYTQRLQQVADSAEDCEEELPTLPDLFTVGDGILCKVVLKMNESKRYVELSCDPGQINRDLPLIALKAGCLLYGAIKSIEEHGCMMDVGIPGIQGFLVKPVQYEFDIGWTVGKCLWCIILEHCGKGMGDILSGENRVIKLSMQNLQQAEVNANAVSSVECLHPGTKVKATIEQVLTDGLLVTCVKYKGCVHKTHLPMQPSMYARGEEIVGRVLYTFADSKVISLSLLPGMLECIQPVVPPLRGISIGDIKEGDISSISKANDVYLRVENELALASFRELSDEKIRDVRQSFTLGKKCRSILTQKVFTLNDIKAGQVVQCEVREVHEKGILVFFSPRLYGFIPLAHISDRPLKNIEKKFPRGKCVKCRVLKVDFKSSRALLTHKKSLLSSKTRMPTSYSDITVGSLFYGYTVAVKDTGIVLGFYNDVKGWVPRSELSTEQFDHPKSVVSVGQVVQCRARYCHPGEQKLRLSLIITDRSNICHNKLNIPGFAPGKLMEAKVMRKSAKNLEVELLPTCHRALLPREHLSDSLENVELLWQYLLPGDMISCVMLLKETSTNMIVTRKDMFLSAAREGLIFSSVSDLQPGLLLPAVVNHHQSYGMFIELPGGLRGLVPRRFAMDRPASDLTELFTIGLSVSVKIIEIDEEKGRFLCSTRMCDCFNDNMDIGIEMLQTYLGERSRYLNSVVDCKAGKAEVCKLGCLVNVEVRCSTDDGYICATDWGMPAIITRLHTGDIELVVGTKVQGVVLHMSTNSEHGTCLELSCDKSLVRMVSRRSQLRMLEEARHGQKIKAKVLLVKDDFVLLVLKQHALGALALMPRKLHPNDVLMSSTANICVGEALEVCVQRCKDDYILVLLAKFVKETADHPYHDLHLGQVVSAQSTVSHDWEDKVCTYHLTVEAKTLSNAPDVILWVAPMRIKSILPNQMNLIIGHVRARVHVSEVLDDESVKKGDFPYRGYHKNQDINVKIIGFRHHKTFKYLPLSHPRLHKTNPECTMKPSKLKLDGCPSDIQAAQTINYTEGDVVVAYVTKFEDNKLWVSVSLTQSGVISVFDLSKDLGVLKQAKKHFLLSRAHRATVLSTEDNGLLHLSLTGVRDMTRRNTVTTGQVTSVSEEGIALWLPGNFRGFIPASDYTENREDVCRNIITGSFIRCMVLCCKDSNHCVLSMDRTPRSESDVKIIRMVTRQTSEHRTKRKLDEDMKFSFKVNDETCSVGGDEKNADMSVEEAARQSVKKRRISDEHLFQRNGVTSFAYTKQKGVGDYGECSLAVKDGFCWDDSAKIRVMDTVESEADDICDQLTIVDEIGLDVLEKRLLKEPDNSMVWIQLMGMMVENGDENRARETGEKALKTISFHQEKERLNMWMALLNLENTYGTVEKLQDTLKRASNACDHKALHQRVATMYDTSGKQKESKEIHHLLVRRYRQDKHVWVDFANYLFKLGQVEEARKLLKRCVLSLPRNTHVSVISQFATLEGKYGERDRAVTMFEKTVMEFPKRTDVMSVYIDMVIRNRDFDKARELLERSLSMKNDSFFFKKYLQFEEKYGTHEAVERLKARMVE